MTEHLWQPFASLESIRLRADLLQSIRHYFQQHEVLEVDTPSLSAAAVPDPFIESFQTRYTPLMQHSATQTCYLHSSPEFPMKRLLAAGSGSIYQISKVFRQGESGRKHNPEFTLLEWYRDGWDHLQLMAEVERLLKLLLSPHCDLGKTQYISYEQAFLQTFSINPHLASSKELQECAKRFGLANVLSDDEPADRFLELLFSHIIEPNLGLTALSGSETKPCISFLYHYPLSQAALAKTAVHDGQLVAERFEVFISGMELANGFHELTDKQEQKRRFEQDNQQRQVMGLRAVPMDQHFLEALAFLPECAGVALGIDRLMMLITQAQHIHEVLAFPFDRA